MGSCILIIILDSQCVFNLARTVLSYIKPPKRAECMEPKHLEAEARLIHQYASHVIHLAMSALDHQIINVSAVRRGTTFRLLTFLFLMVPVFKCLHRRILNFMYHQIEIFQVIMLKIQQET